MCLVMHKNHYPNGDDGDRNHGFLKENDVRRIFLTTFKIVVVVRHIKNKSCFRSLCTLSQERIKDPVNV